MIFTRTKDIETLTYPKNEWWLSKYDNGEEKDKGRSRREEGSHVCGGCAYESARVHVVSTCPNECKQYSGGEEALECDSLGREHFCTVPVCVCVCVCVCEHVCHVLCVAQIRRLHSNYIPQNIVFSRSYTN